jgi:hypothetical protein
LTVFRNEAHCYEAPRLLTFYLSFLLRTRTIPFPTASENLQRAIAVSELAAKELPATFTMGRAIPGKISEAFVSMWGTRCITWDDAVPNLPPMDVPIVSIAEEFSQGLKDAKMEEIDVDALTTDAAQREVLTDNLDDSTAEGVEASASEAKDSSNTDDTSGWGASANTNSVDSAGAWSAANGTGGADSMDTGAWGSPAAWGAAVDGNDASASWDPAAADEASWSIHKTTAIELMGPTPLPLTHSTGVVEESTRRLVAVYPPETAPASLVFADSVDAVEHELQRRFGRVLLAPWGASAADSDIIKPSILAKSRGAVIERDTEGKKKVVGNEGSLPVKPHDPLKDNITVLVDPEAVSHLVANMGIGATWVQIIRASEDGAVERKGTSSGYWYMEGMSQIMASFHTDDGPCEFKDTCFPPYTHFLTPRNISRGMLQNVCG